MSRLLHLFIGVLLSILAGASCTSTSNWAPPVAAATFNTRGSEHVTQQQLNAGRTLFATRCIECHVLPAIKEHSSRQWPELVGRMSKRADLKADEQKEVVAYILAVRSQL